MERRKQQESTIRHHAHTGTALGLTLAAAAALLGTVAFGNAHAQSTSSMIHGLAPAGATVIAQSNTGAGRRTTVNDNGRYTLRALPMGVYTVTLEKDGKVTDTRHHIPLSPGRGMEVDFACPHDQCAAPKGTR